MNKYDLLLDLILQGLTDSEIVLRMKLSQQRISQMRKVLGIPAKRSMPKNTLPAITYTDSEGNQVTRYGTGYAKGAFQNVTAKPRR